VLCALSCERWWWREEEEEGRVSKQARGSREHTVERKRGRERAREKERERRHGYIHVSCYRPPSTCPHTPNTQSKNGRARRSHIAWGSVGGGWGRGC